MARKKLLVLTSTYPRWQGDHEPGFVYELSRRMQDKFEIVVLCPRAPGAKDTESFDGVSIVRYAYAPRSYETLVNNGGIVTNLRKKPLKLLLLPSLLISQMWYLRKLINTERPDAIHAHWLIPQGLIVALLTLFKKDIPPMLVTSHGADLFALKGRVFDSLKKFVARRASGLTVVSSAMKVELEKLRIPLTIDVLPMGVDLQSRFTPKPDSKRTKNEILFVGRLVEKKGLHTLIQALPLILESCPDVVLKIAGFGPEKQYLETLVRQMNLEQTVSFVGACSQTELPSMYRSASVFVAPFVEATSGDQEGLGLVVVEALGCGCPTVVSDIPATNDVVKDISGVSVFPAGNREALAASVLLQLNDDINQVNIEKSLEILRERFDWAQVSGKYVSKLTYLMSVGIERQR